jgi:hypothetical protein
LKRQFSRHYGALQAQTQIFRCRKFFSPKLELKLKLPIYTYIKRDREELYYLSCMWCFAHRHIYNHQKIVKFSHKLVVSSEED